MTQDVAEEIRVLEESLWQAESRFDFEWMDSLLAPTFMEFGRSGRVYGRNDMLDGPVATFYTQLPLPNFAVQMLDEDVALVTYRSIVQYEGGEHLVANRSSVWRRHEDGWQLEFHQGTPVTEPKHMATSEAEPGLPRL